MARKGLPIFDRLLIGMGRIIRGVVHRGPTEFAYAGAPEKFSHSDLASVMQRHFGRSAREDAADHLGLTDVLDWSPYDSIEAPLEYAHAWALSVATLRAMAKAKRGQLVSGALERSVGFVASTSGAVSFGAIFYVSSLRLLQRAPLFLDVGTVRLPVVLRPLRDIDASVGHGFRRGRTTSLVRIGDRIGSLTAAHVVGDKETLRAGDVVDCLRSRGDDPCTHEVLAADRVMDAAVMADDGDINDLDAVLSTPAVGYFPVEIDGPHGPVHATVFELGPEQGVIAGTRGNSPSTAAEVLINTALVPGWSGAMVRETLYRTVYGVEAASRPYGMFLGPRQLVTGTAGRVHLLRQHEVVWDLELLEPSR